MRTLREGGVTATVAPTPDLQVVAVVLVEVTLEVVEPEVDGKTFD
jgi:hypothetical protein